jgi:peptidoglycan/LPS O-acetylase OafA/YrhL
LASSAVAQPQPATGYSAGASHLDSLQALRALAATTVIFDHIPFARWGSFGVDIFFVLSGFVICHITATDTSHFFLKRIFRVVPLYWICTLGVAGIALLSPGLLVSTSFSAAALLKSLFFIPFRRPDHKIAPLLFLGWTLHYEMLFYAIFGIALKVTRKHARVLAIAGLIGLFIVGKLCRMYHHTNVVLLFYSKFVVMEFVFGILCYILWIRYGAAIRRVPALVLMAAATASYAFFVLMDLHILDSYGPYFRHVPDILLKGVPASLILLFFLSLEGRFKFPALALLIGDASYSLYLLHPYILESLNRKMFALDHFSPFTFAVMILSIAVCYSCAVVSFKLFERPSNKFLRNYFLRRKSNAGDTLIRTASPELQADTSKA